MQLFRVKMCVYIVAIWGKFKVQHPIDIPPNRNHNFLPKAILSNDWLSLFFSGNPLHFWYRITQKYSIFLAGNNYFPETIIKWIAEQLLTNFCLLLRLRIGQFMRFLSGTFVVVFSMSIELKQRNLIDRITIYEVLLKRNEVGPFLMRIITGNKKWVKC